MFYFKNGLSLQKTKAFLGINCFRSFFASHVFSSHLYTEQVGEHYVYLCNAYLLFTWWTSHSWRRVTDGARAANNYVAAIIGGNYNNDVIDLRSLVARQKQIAVRSPCHSCVRGRQFSVSIFVPVLAWRDLIHPLPDYILLSMWRAVRKLMVDFRLQDQQRCLLYRQVTGDVYDQ